MGSSSYHYKQCKIYKSEQTKFEGWVTKLKAFDSGFTKSDVTSGYSDVNSRLNKTISNMESGLKGNNLFVSNLAPVKAAIEKSVSADTELCEARGAIKAEIASITAKVNEARANKDYHHREWLAALTREAAKAIV